MNKLAMPVGLVLEPLSAVDISVGMAKPANTMSFVMAELSIVAPSVRPGHGALAMALVSKPLPGVDGIARKLDHSPFVNAVSFGQRFIPGAELIPIRMEPIGQVKPHRLPCCNIGVDRIQSVRRAAGAAPEL